jgi:hypothetical protein
VQKQLGRVAQMWEIGNWCIRNPLEGEDLAAGDPRMTALLGYIAKAREEVASLRRRQAARAPAFFAV